MSNYAISLKRSTALLAALLFTAALTVANLSIFGIGIADAAQLSGRSLTLTSSLPGTSSTGAANSQTNGTDATHTFTFDPGTDGTVRSMQFEYCTTGIGACTGPTNIEVETGTAITTQSEQTAGAFSNAYTIDSSSDSNTLKITNATGNALTSDGSETVTIAFDDIRNPDTVATFFVRITTYSDDAWTTVVDEGTVASAITTGIAITTKVVETLGFSTTADTSGGVPAEVGTTSCDPLTGSGAIALGDSDNTLSIATAYDDHSVFRLYTNSANGVVVQYAGDTLRKSASDTITAIGGTASASDVGAEQFGLAVDTGGGSISNVDTSWPTDTAGRLELDAEYDGGTGTITDGGTATFAFDAASPAAPKTIAASDVNFGGYVDCDTAAVRYIANISPLTAAGTYTTTIVYYAVPTY